MVFRTENACVGPRGLLGMRAPSRSNFFQTISPNNRLAHPPLGLAIPTPRVWKILDFQMCQMMSKITVAYIANCEKLKQALKENRMFNYHCPQMKLWEGNVFTGICLLWGG